MGIINKSFSIDCGEDFHKLKRTLPHRHDKTSLVDEEVHRILECLYNDVCNNYFPWATGRILIDDVVEDIYKARVNESFVDTDGSLSSRKSGWFDWLSSNVFDQITLKLINQLDEFVPRSELNYFWEMRYTPMSLSILSTSTLMHDGDKKEVELTEEQLVNQSIIDQIDNVVLQKVKNEIVSSGTVELSQRTVDKLLSLQAQPIYRTYTVPMGSNNSQLGIDLFSTSSSLYAMVYDVISQCKPGSEVNIHIEHYSKAIYNRCVKFIVTLFGRYAPRDVDLRLTQTEIKHPDSAIIEFMTAEHRRKIRNNLIKLNHPSARLIRIDTLPEIDFIKTSMKGELDLYEGLSEEEIQRRIDFEEMTALQLEAESKIPVMLQPPAVRYAALYQAAEIIRASNEINTQTYMLIASHSPKLMMTPDDESAILEDEMHLFGLRDIRDLNPNALVYYRKCISEMNTLLRLHGKELLEEIPNPVSYDKSVALANLHKVKNDIWRTGKISMDSLERIGCYKSSMLLDVDNMVTAEVKPGLPKELVNRFFDGSKIVKAGYMYWRIANELQSLG